MNEETMKFRLIQNLVNGRILFWFLFKNKFKKIKMAIFLTFLVNNIF